MNSRKILVLGASGLIGRFVTDDLRARGFRRRVARISSVAKDQRLRSRA
jgi:nucleoside-diphosphate-sugar epimerase